MAIRKVARMGHPVLRKKARELNVEEIKSTEFRRLVQDMLETMNEYSGIGIAAPQIHESLSVAIIDYDEANPCTIIINPKITVLDETKQAYWEGCLSVPEIRGLVERPRKVQIDYLDLHANEKQVIAEGFLATVFQHELDHLFGVLFVDRVQYTPGSSPIAFIEEYQRYLSPKEDDDIQELPD